MEREILKKAAAFLREAELLRFEFIAAEKAHFPVAALCRVMKVSRSAFYAWSTREESERSKRDRQLEVLIRAAHDGSRKTYGSPRVHAELREHGHRISRKRVIRLMQRADLRARVRRRYRRHVVAENEQPLPANILDRNFDADAPNKAWVADTTELKTSSGRLFLAAVIDLYARVVVGWAISAVNDRHLVLRALDAGLRRRGTCAGLVHHSDQGSPYASEDYQTLLKKRGITSSMSRKANCYDNAVVESFFATLKAELGERFESNRDAKAKLFDYIEVFYNQKRRHSSLGYATPAEYERAASDNHPILGHQRS